jgi:SAM-dependent methyltransferase
MPGPPGPAGRARNEPPMSPNDLIGFGRWYSERQGDTGDAWHRTLIDPPLLGRLGDLPERTRVLDLGCGNGYLARRLARRKARVTGIDLSAPLLAVARAWERREPLGIRYLRRDAARLTGLADGGFDVAFANMSLIDIEPAGRAIAEVGRVLKDGGRFVFSLSHPCFDVDNRSTWVVEVEKPAGREPTIYRKVTAYREPHSDLYRWTFEDGRVAETVGYHRPLGWYADRLREAGFVILALDEPRPQPEYVGRRQPKAWLDAIPLHLIVEARREPRRKRRAPARRGGVPAA